MIIDADFQKYIRLGLSVIPCFNKQPAGGSWKDCQTSIPPLNRYDDITSEQIACVCGKVSGGLVCIDFDIKNGDMFTDWMRIVSTNFPEMLSKLVIEKSPSGGYHVIYRTNAEVRNMKLAKNTEKACTIETRGEGGYFVCYPSPNYDLYYSDFDNIQTILPEESEQLLTIARSLNQYTEEVTLPPLRDTIQTTSGGLSPFDDYDQRHNVVSLLTSHGWKVLFYSSGVAYLRRPGKNSGISATWGKVPDRFYVFTTSTAFVNEHIYKASAVYAMLEHNGDYNAAAKSLYEKGYGDRYVKKEKEVEQKKQNQEVQLKLIDTKNVVSRLVDIKQHGYPKGKTTGWLVLDNFISMAKGQVTVITGVPSAGKSEFMDALSVNLMLNCGWKFAVFSPENYPAEMHYHKLIEKIGGCSLELMQDFQIEDLVRIVNANFFFLDALEEELGLTEIFEQTLILIKMHGVDALVIDPWNEIELDRPANISESDFIGKLLRKARKFARKHNIHLFIVAHPTKLTKNRDGKYPIPELWDVSGSAHWRNKTDNGLCIHRDYDEGCTIVFIQKVKFKYFGHQGECKLYYEEKSGRYLETNPNEINGISASWYG